jgi:hypothetical protein
MIRSVGVATTVLLTFTVILALLGVSPDAQLSKMNRIKFLATGDRMCIL